MTADAMKNYDNDLEKIAECRLRLRFKRNTFGKIHVV